MPKTDGNDRARAEELPKTLQRSDRKAQDTYAQTYDSAMEEYDDAERAARTAWAQLKHTHEKVGDRWEQKEQYGDSDDRTASAGRDEGETAGGVNARASKEHLYEQAQRLGIEGRSEMTKDELVEALEKESRRRTSGS